MTTDLGLSDIEQKVFLNFLEQLASSNVSSNDEYNKVIEKYNDIVRKKPDPINLEGITQEASEFLGKSIPSFKSTQWPSSFSSNQKKGFDKLYNYGSDKVKRALREGEGKDHTLDLYSARANALSILAEAGIEVSADGGICKKDRDRALAILDEHNKASAYCATTKQEDILDNNKVEMEEDKKIFSKNARPEEVIAKMCKASNSTGYFNNSLRNPSRYYKHVAAMCMATDKALASIVTEFPYFVTMSYLDSKQSAMDSHEFNSSISINDGPRDIIKKAEAFFGKKITAYQSTKECEDSKEKYESMTSNIPAIASEITPLIIDVDRKYVKYFNDYNNEKSSFNFLEYVERQLGCDVAWDADGYFLVYAPKNKKKTIEDEFQKYLPNLIAASYEEENELQDLCNKIEDKTYKAKIIAIKACMFKHGNSEVLAEIVDEEAPNEVQGCILIAEMIENDAIKNIKKDDEVQVALSVSPRNIRIKSVAANNLEASAEE